MAPGAWPRLSNALSGHDSAAFIAADAPTVAWLTGFEGSAGVVVVGRCGAVLGVDFRYAEKAAEAASDGLRVHVAAKASNLLRETVEVADGLVPEGEPIGFSPGRVTVAQKAAWEEALPGPLEDAGDWVSMLRAVKDEREIARLEASAALLRDLFLEAAKWLEPGVAEREVAAKAVAWALAHGAERMAFDPIVASGPLSSRPHAGFSYRHLSAGEPVTLDLGVMVDGWASDMTRTWAVPGGADPDPAVVEVHDLVRAAHAAGCEATVPGAPVSGVDDAARGVIEAGGHGDRFGHATGHGIGRETHEAPRVGPGCPGELAPGMAITVEPGVYLEGEFGVRVEDTLVVTEDGHRNLGEGVPRELKISR